MSPKSCADAYAKSRMAGNSPARAGSGSGTRMGQKEITGRAKNSSPGVLAGSEEKFRLLAPNELGSVIFGCTNATMNECLSKNLFGLPSRHMVYVQNIKKGMHLFLFNYTDRKLHGVYEAISDGKKNIDTTAWASHGTGQTMYPAQVSARIDKQCESLRENDFKHVIRDNYYGQSNHFKFELDHQQTYNLIMLFLGQLHPPHKNKFSIPEVLNPLSPAMSSMSLEQGENLQIDSQLQSPASHQRFQDENGGRRLLYDESEQEAEFYLPNEFDNAGTEIYGEDLCISDSELPSPAGSASSRPSSSLLPEENSFATLQAPNAPSMNTASYLFHEREIQHLSASLKQIRQEGVELREMVEAAQVEQHRELQSANTLLQFLKMKIGSEVSSLRTEVAELREQMRIFFSEKHEENMKDFETSCIPDSGSAPTHNSSSAVYIIGGRSGNQWLETVDIFCPPENSLKPAFPMRTPRPFPAAIAFDKCIYVLGGGHESSWFDIVEMYDQTKGQWTLCSPMNLRRGCLAGVTISQGLIALGGENEQGPFSDVEWYDACTGEWIVSANMLEKRSFPAAVELGGAVYSLGGFDGSRYLRTVERLDSRQGSWTSIASMNSPRAGLSAASFNGKIYALGGFDGQSFLNTVEVYDQRANKWEEAVPTSIQRAHGAAVVVHNLLYLIGGLSDRNKPIEFMECYQDGKGWQALGPAPIGKRCYMSAVVL